MLFTNGSSDREWPRLPGGPTVAYLPPVEASPAQSPRKVSPPLPAPSLRSLTLARTHGTAALPCVSTAPALQWPDSILPVKKAEWSF